MEQYKQFEKEWSEHWWMNITEHLSRSEINKLIIFCSKNENLTWDIIQAHPQYDWNVMGMLGRNPNITWDIVKENLDKNWDYNRLSKHPNITWDIVKANPTVRWNYQSLSVNPNITWEIVKAHPEIAWNYNWLAGNPNITWDIIQNNPDADWFEPNHLLQPNLEFDSIRNNSNFRNINLRCYIFNNKMEGEKRKFIENKYRELHQRQSTEQIHPELINTVLHPDNFSKLYGLGHFENYYLC